MKGEGLHSLTNRKRQHLAKHKHAFGKYVTRMHQQAEQEILSPFRLPMILSRPTTCRLMFCRNKCYTTLSYRPERM